MEQWKEFTGVLPAAVVGVGATPVLHDDAWWALRNDNAIMRLPASIVGVGATALGFGALDVNDADTRATAVAMNNALAAYGYRQSDQGLYVAFQKAAGLTADGYPGRNTMGALQTVLTAMGVTIAPVPVYPWLASGSYDGVNAPLLSQWMPSAPSGSSTLVTNNTTNVSSLSLFGLPTWAVWVLGAAAAAGIGFVAWSLLSDGKRHSNSSHKGATVHHLHRHRARRAAESAAKESPRKRRRSKRSRRKSKRSRK